MHVVVNRLCPIPHLLAAPPPHRPSKENAESAAALEAKQTDAAENLGDLDILDAVMAKAAFYVNTGDKVRISLKGTPTRWKPW